MLEGLIKDSLPLWGVFLITVLMLLFAIECGFQLGKRGTKISAEAQKSQVSAIMGAALGLLAFILAFTFSMAGSRFEARKALVIEEANAIGTTYLRADFLAESETTEIKTLLSEYVGLRIQGVEAVQKGLFEQVQQILVRSEQLQDQLWSLAVNAKSESPVNAGLFAQSVNALIDIHTERVSRGIHSRIPETIWYALYFLAFLSMTVMGYHSGLTRIRSSVATSVLVFTFSAVILLIVDLDRPGQSLFSVSQQVMVELEAKLKPQK